MTTPITDLVTLAKMSPRATAGLRAAGVGTAEQAAAMTDAELLAIPYFKGESLGRLRQWQRAGAEGVPVEQPGPSRSPAERASFAKRFADRLIGAVGSREIREADLAERLLVEMVKSSNNPGAQLADMAWAASERFYDRLEARKEKLHGERGAGDAGGAGAAADRPEEPVG